MHPDLYGADPMLKVKCSHLTREVKELKDQNTSLVRELTTLQTILNVTGITKLFNNLAPKSIYKRFFLGTYRTVLLEELIARYQFTDITGDVDSSTVIRIMNKMASEASGDGMVTIYGELIKMHGG